MLGDRLAEVPHARGWRTNRSGCVSMNGLRGLARGAMLHGAAVAALVVSSPSLAHAQSPEDLAMARALGTEGVRLADAGDCAAAIPKLIDAEKLYHAPTTLERLGECEIKT